jgi:hypothetical protein
MRDGCSNRNRKNGRYVVEHCAVLDSVRHVRKGAKAMSKEKRLIDANALKEKLQEHHDFFVDGCGGFHYLTPKDKARVDEITNCIAEICNTPTIDAVEVVHGRWIEVLVLQTDISSLYDYTCSECEIVSCRVSNYCPNCGAKMDGDGDA